MKQQEPSAEADGSYQMADPNSAGDEYGKLEFIVLSKPICFFFSKYGNITISIWIVIMKIATKLF